MSSSILNKDVIWQKFELYEKTLSKAELTIIKENFNLYCSGNGIEFESSPHMENQFYMFKHAWIMSAIFSK